MLKTQRRPEAKAAFC